jgi:hypothetical protein
MGEKRNVCRLLVGKPKGRRPLGRPRQRRMEYIKMNLGEVGWGGVDWIGLAKDRNRWRALVHPVMVPFSVLDRYQYFERTCRPHHSQRRRQLGSPKHMSLSTKSWAMVSQKTIILTFTAIGMPNQTLSFITSSLL